MLPTARGAVASTGGVPALVTALAAEGLDVSALADDGAEPARVVVVPATLVKGLEFDAVVVRRPGTGVSAPDLIAFHHQLGGVSAPGQLSSDRRKVAPLIHPDGVVCGASIKLCATQPTMALWLVTGVHG